MLSSSQNYATDAHPRSGVDQGAAMALLIQVVQNLSLARGLDRIVEIVRHAARDLTSADGATFVLRDGPNCFYVDENAISPLWKGQRFPLEACISGWTMLNGRSTVIPDIYADPRIPHAAYQPTFVRSMAMVPIRSASPIGAIGVYWARYYECTANELMLLEALANTTAVAMENVNVYQTLENEVKQRTRELQALNEELEAFSSAVSHDLRAPLRAISAELELRTDSSGTLPAASVAKVRASSARMACLIADLLRLSRIGRGNLKIERVDVGSLASAALERLQMLDPDRHVRIRIDVKDRVAADAGLVEVLVENLISNAWKFSAGSNPSEIEITSSTDDEGRCVFRVADNGVGFDPGRAQKLFEPFSRLHDEREFPGIGIGLATARRVVQRHGGRIWARSNGGNGAEFLFYLSDVAASPQVPGLS